MGMSRAGMRGFMAAVETTLSDLFPAVLRIESEEYACTGVGGAGLNEFLQGGRAEEGKRYFRLLKSLRPARPMVGAVVVWVDATGPVTRFKITECPDRPHELAWTLVCEPFN